MPLLAVLLAPALFAQAPSTRVYADADRAALACIYTPGIWKCDPAKLAVFNAEDVATVEGPASTQLSLTAVRAGPDAACVTALRVEPPATTAAFAQTSLTVAGGPPLPLAARTDGGVTELTRVSSATSSACIIDGLRDADVVAEVPA